MFGALCLATLLTTSSTTPVDLNHASLEALIDLPGIGPKLAREIVARRPYSRTRDVLRVRGVGPKLFARLRPRLTVGGPPEARPRAAVRRTARTDPDAKPSSP